MSGSTESENLMLVMQAFIDAHTTRNMDRLSELMTDDFVWRLLPESLGVPAKNKRQFLLQIAELSRIFTSIKLQTPIEVIQASDAIVVHIMGEGTLANGKPYLGEYVKIFRFKGGRVRSITDFTDSELMRSVFEAADGEGYKLLNQTYGE
ncbi:hypothetical protein MVEN_01861700 [Mycena venus]|uniref:SnoaL-like domain-containing protein n=1 Tax=Mycena venus TaxID=2733690 RepID=A0A8H7CKT2_9AGAR|nr:hypothetical protein MVEN_01861700 [Mycena venus]